MASVARNPGYKRISRHFLKTCGFKLLSVDETAVEAVVRHPGPTMSDFDVYGQPKLWNMMNLVVSGRMFVHHQPLDETGRTFRDFEKLTSDRLTFLVTSEVCFTKALYDPDIPKSSLLTTVRGGYIGNTSFNSHSFMKTESNELLISNVNQVVSIDMETRRPKPLPDWWKVKYAESAKKFESYKLERFPRRENTSVYHVKVAWSDTDMNNHATWSAYVRYAKDAAHHAVRTGSLPDFEENLGKGISKIQSHYLGECLEGDELTVYIWEDSRESYQLKCHIDKNEECIFQTVISFF